MRVLLIALPSVRYVKATKSINPTAENPWPQGQGFFVGPYGIKWMNG